MDEKLLVELTTEIICTWLPSQKEVTPKETAAAFSEIFDTVLEKYQEELAAKQALGTFFPLVDDDFEFGADDDDDETDHLIAELVPFPIHGPDDDDDGGLLQ